MKPETVTHGGIGRLILASAYSLMAATVFLKSSVNSCADETAAGRRPRGISALSGTGAVTTIIETSRLLALKLVIVVLLTEIRVWLRLWIWGRSRIWLRIPATKASAGAAIKLTSCLYALGVIVIIILALAWMAVGKSRCETTIGVTNPT
jgi:hypothetical protein